MDPWSLHVFPLSNTFMNCSFRAEHVLNMLASHHVAKDINIERCFCRNTFVQIDHEKMKPPRMWCSPPPAWHDPCYWSWWEHIRCGNFWWKFSGLKWTVLRWVPLTFPFFTQIICVKKVDTVERRFRSVSKVPDVECRPVSICVSSSSMSFVCSSCTTSSRRRFRRWHHLENLNDLFLLRTWFKSHARRKFKI